MKSIAFLFTIFFCQVVLGQTASYPTKVYTFLELKSTNIYNVYSADSVMKNPDLIYDTTSQFDIKFAIVLSDTVEIDSIHFSLGDTTSYTNIYEATLKFDDSVTGNSISNYYREGNTVFFTLTSFYNIRRVQARVRVKDFQGLYSNYITTKNYN